MVGLGAVGEDVTFGEANAGSTNRLIDLVKAESIRRSSTTS